MSLVPTGALWTWNTSVPHYPVPTSYLGSSQTKTGLCPQDLKDFLGLVPAYRNPPRLMSDTEIMERIRRSEDWVEQQTSILLTPTWVASPPSLTAAGATNANLATKGGGPMLLGVDYDLTDNGYDFKFDRGQDEGWLMQQLRYRPLRICDGGTTAIKQISYIYPLLSQFFQIPPTWYVEDLDFGLIRIVPSANLGLLPMFAIQLGVEGFSQSVPGGISIQYTAGLTPYDYASRFRFMRELVLCGAAVSILATMQGSVSMGLGSIETLMDGTQTKLKYVVGGAYANEIKQFGAMAEAHLETARWQVGGPMMETLG